MAQVEEVLVWNACEEWLVAGEWDDRPVGVMGWGSGYLSEVSSVLLYLHEVKMSLFLFDFHEFMLECVVDEFGACCAVDLLLDMGTMRFDCMG